MPLTKKQIDELNLAAKRRTPEDLKNLAHAKKVYGFEPTVTGPKSDETPFIKTKDSAAVFDTRTGQQFMNQDEFFKVASDFRGSPVSEFEEGLVREVEAGELPDLPRSLEIEQSALKKYQNITGRNPETREDYETLFQMAYGNKIPKSLLQTLEQMPGTGDRTTSSQRSTITDPTDIDQLKQGVIEAKRDVDATADPNFALSILQDALRTKAGTMTQPIGESEIFKKAGVGGFGALSQSLAARGDEMRQNHATFLNTINTMSGVLRDRANIALKNYEFAMDLYEREKDRIAKADEAVQDHHRALELIQAQHENRVELEAYKNKYQLKEGDDEFVVFNPVTGEVKPAGGFRTERHNNPIAAAVTVNGTNQFTRALDEAGIAWGYGDPFPDDPNMVTIDIKGDGTEGARAILSSSNALEGWYAKAPHTAQIVRSSGLTSSTEFANASKADQDALIQAIQSAENGTAIVPKPKTKDSDKKLTGEKPLAFDDLAKYDLPEGITEKQFADFQYTEKAPEWYRTMREGAELRSIMPDVLQTEWEEERERIWLIDNPEDAENPGGYTDQELRKLRAIDIDPTNVDNVDKADKFLYGTEKEKALIEIEKIFSDMKDAGLERKDVEKKYKKSREDQGRDSKISDDVKKLLDEIFGEE